MKQKKTSCTCWINKTLYCVFVAVPHTGPWGLSPVVGTRCFVSSQHALGDYCCLHTCTGALAFENHTPVLCEHTHRHTQEGNFCSVHIFTEVLTILLHRQVFKYLPIIYKNGSWWLFLNWSICWFCWLTIRDIVSQYCYHNNDVKSC